jgi:hypothetical protein
MARSVSWCFLHGSADKSADFNRLHGRSQSLKAVSGPAGGTGGGGALVVGSSSSSAAKACPRNLSGMSSSENSISSSSGSCCSLIMRPSGKGSWLVGVGNE